MKLVVVVVHSDVNLGLAKAVLSRGANGLRDPDAGQRFVSIELNMRLKRVDSTCPQPLIAKLCELKARAHASVILAVIGVLESANEVRKLSISPLILLEIKVKCLLHVIQAKDFVRLLQKGCTFTVGNSIENGLSLGHRQDTINHWVRCLKDVRIDSFELSSHEINPGVLVLLQFGRVSHDEVGHVGRE
jgi:hypothetical protein